jgi:hypothetical protein
MGPVSALSDREPAPLRPVPRQKRSFGTSHCAGASISYALAPREAGPYRFDRECFCLSPEAHGAQFLEGVAGPWRRGNA